MTASNPRADAVSAARFLAIPSTYASHELPFALESRANDRVSSKFAEYARTVSSSRGRTAMARSAS